MNKIGPKTDPYGTPCSSTDQELCNLLIFFINLASLPAVWHMGYTKLYSHPLPLIWSWLPSISTLYNPTPTHFQPTTIHV